MLDTSGSYTYSKKFSANANSVVVDYNLRAWSNVVEYAKNCSPAACKAEQTASLQLVSLDAIILDDPRDDLVRLFRFNRNACVRKVALTRIEQEFARKPRLIAKDSC